MSKLHVDETTDRGHNELDLAWAFGAPTLDDLGDETYSEFDDDDFEDSRDLDDWLSAELRLGQQDDD